MTTKLTAKQDKFAYNMAQGMTQRVAYRIAYPKSSKWKDSTVDSRASESFATKKIKTAYLKYIDEVRTKEKQKEKNRSIAIEDGLFEEMLKHFKDYEGVKEFVEEAILKSLPKDYEEFDEWLKRNRRKDVSNDVRYEVFYKAGFRCEACGDNPTVNQECVLHVDHIMPFSMGGIDHISNYQCLCEKCNTSKNNRYAIDHRK